MVNRCELFGALMPRELVNIMNLAVFKSGGDRQIMNQISSFALIPYGKRIRNEESL